MPVGRLGQQRHGNAIGSKSKLGTYLNSTARATPSSPSPPNPGFFLRGWAALEAFAQWTNDHYGTTFGSSCYYSTKCLADPASAKSDTTTWVSQCCPRCRTLLKDDSVVPYLQSPYSA